MPSPHAPFYQSPFYFKIAKIRNQAIMPNPSTLAPLQEHFYRVKEIIRQEGMWERVPESARDFSPENLENLVKYAYFAGFIDMGQVIRLLFLKKGERQVLLTKWYEDIREKGCWLC